MQTVADDIKTLCPAMPKGGLISEFFFTLVQISQKKMPNSSPEHLLFWRIVLNRAQEIDLASVFGDMI